MKHILPGMESEKTIAYTKPNVPGRQEKTILDVESVNCVVQNDGDHNAIIVNHSCGPNTVIEPVERLLAVEK